MRPSWVSVVAGTYLAEFALGLTATADVPSHLFFLSRQRAPVDQPNNFAAGLSLDSRSRRRLFCKDIAVVGIAHDWRRLWAFSDA